MTLEGPNLSLFIHTYGLLKQETKTYEVLNVLGH